jgi:hypothetical protein
MLRKIILLTITLLVIGLTVVSAQSAADAAEMQRLTLDWQAGRISFEEYQRRIAEISIRSQGGSSGSTSDLERRIQQAEERNAQTYQDEILGNTSGWPSASVFRRYGVTLSQPNIADAVYSYTLYGEDLEIYVQFRRNSNSQLPAYNTRIQTGETIKRHVEAAVGSMVRGTVDSQSEAQISDPQNRNTNVTRFYITVSVETGEAGTNNQPHIKISFEPGSAGMGR